MKIAVGVDAGSSYIKIVYYDVDENKVIEKDMASLSISYEHTIDTMLEKFMKKHNIFDFFSKTCCGYGKNSYSKAQYVVNELKALSVAIKRLDPSINTIIDIGGQDSKVFTLNEKKDIEDFKMNDKCAAGAGKLLEISAKTLNLNVTEECKNRIHKNLSITKTCAVFMQSEIISLISEGNNAIDLFYAIKKSIVSQIMSNLNSITARENYAFTGGVSQDNDIFFLLNESINKPIKRFEDTQHLTALGATLYGIEKRRDKNE